MPQYCDVALPLPLDEVFTYRINGAVPVVGGRVLVPFRSERMTGIVTALRDSSPLAASGVQIKSVLQMTTGRRWARFFGPCCR